MLVRCGLGLYVRDIRKGGCWKAHDCSYTVHTTPSRDRSSWISFQRFVSRLSPSSATDGQSRRHGQGHEARFFSLFSITDKSASFLGPAAIALVTDATGEMRYAFLVLAVLLAVPVPVLLWRVDEEKGKRDARMYDG